MMTLKYENIPIVVISQELVESMYIPPDIKAIKFCKDEHELLFKAKAVKEVMDIIFAKRTNTPIDPRYIVDEYEEIIENNENNEKITFIHKNEIKKMRKIKKETFPMQANKQLDKINEKYGSNQNFMISLIMNES